jgi:hypothetical protein
MGRFEIFFLISIFVPIHIATNSKHEKGKGVKMEMKQENFQTAAVILPTAPDNCSTSWGMWALGNERAFAEHPLNVQQKYAYKFILHKVLSNAPAAFFIDGSGGTGKTFLYRAILTTIKIITSCCFNHCIIRSCCIYISR